MTSDSAETHGRRGVGRPIVPIDMRDPGDDFLQQEIEENRRSELWLIPKAILALAVVVVLVVLREVYFA